MPDAFVIALGFRDRRPARRAGRPWFGRIAAAHPGNDSYRSESP
jgi:hypothetical protein